MQSPDYALTRGGSEPAFRSEGSTWDRRAGAFLFCAAVASSPFAIVLLGPGKSGGWFVAGYVCATLTAPLVAVGLINAANTLFRGNWLDSVLGATIYAVLVLLISIAAILWAIL